MKVLKSDDAVALIPSGATVAITGTCQVGVPDTILRALGDRFMRTGSPVDLTLYFPVEPGHRPGLGVDHIAYEGLIQRVVAGSFIFVGTKEVSRLNDLISKHAIAAYNLPMGTMFQLLRETAAHRPGVITKVGLGTFVEPKRGGGKLTAKATDDLVEYVTIDGDTYLRYRPLPIDVAIIRATTSDEDGNLTMEHEASLQGMLVMAQAAKASGGTVIAEVKRVAKGGSLRPHDVRVPGLLVDAVVVDPRQEQLLEGGYTPGLAGEICQVDLDPPTAAELPLAARIIVSRASDEVADGCRLNLGYGISAYIPQILNSRRPAVRAHYFVEQGAYGGLPLPGRPFGAAMNPVALTDMPSWFDYLDSGAFDLSCLGMGEVARDGSVRNHVLDTALPGCGGFVDITSSAPRIIFCGTFTAGGLRIGWDGSALHIEQEGRYSKFVSSLDAPTFNGPLATARGQDALYITERAVFRLTEAGLTLLEVAPGISPDVVEEALPFPIKVDPSIKEMSAKHFSAETGDGPPHRSVPLSRMPVSMDRGA